MKSFEVEVERVDKVEKKQPNGTVVVEEVKTINKVPIAPVKIQKGRGQGSEYLAPKELSTMGFKDFLRVFSEDDV